MKKNCFISALVIVVSLFVLLACSQTGDNKPAETGKPVQQAQKNDAVETQVTGLEGFEGLSGTLDIAGGTAHIPVMEEAARRIMTANPNIRITVTGGGSGVGVQKAGEGLVNIGNAGRPLSDEEIEKYGLVSFPFCVDGVAACVNPGNAVNSLSTQQLQDIFAGKITNWKDVGGQDATINLYTRDEASGTRSTFQKQALKGGAVAEGANVVASNGAMKTAVSNDTSAIGYVGIGHLDDSITGVAIDGVEPLQEKAKSGEYPVTRKLFMNTKGEPEGLTKAFIKYILSDSAKDIIIESGYIPL